MKKQISIRIDKNLFIYLFIVIFLSPVNLYAHRVYVFAWAENGKIFTESKFASNKFVKKGNVVIQDAKGNVLLNGITSDNGSFVFDIPENIKPNLKIDTDAYLLIIIEAGLGHKGEWKIGFDEITLANTGGSAKGTAKKKEEEKIKAPSFLNVSVGVLLIFIFFISMTYYKKRKKNDRQ